MNDFETAVQQLVDGELSHPERIRLVERLESKPELWRQVGLALIEGQVLKETLKPAGDDTRAYSQSTERVASLRKSERHNLRSSRIPTLGWLAAIAASLLFGFFIGSSSITNSGPIAVQSPPKNGLSLQTLKHAEFADAIARSATPIPPHFRRELLKAGFHVNELEKMKTVTSSGLWRL